MIKQINLTALFTIFFRLGCTSFGGPTAHISYFHHEFVTKRKWYKAEEYLQLVALCQFLPGPASSQVGMAIGFNRRGYIGSLISFVGFTLPSFILMTGAAFAVNRYTAFTDSSIFYALKLIAVAVVFHAIIAMIKAQIKTKISTFICLMSVSTALMVDGVFSHISIITTSGLFGYLCLNSDHPNTNSPETKKNFFQHNKYFGLSLLIIFFLLLTLSPIYNAINPSNYSLIFDSFYRTGSLVFGGGHVVLPLLESEFVTPNIINGDTFLYGYSLAQAIPGPLFTFASYLGFIASETISPFLGALIATLAIFLPGYLLVISLLPYWQSLCTNQKLQSTIGAINASVIGLLMASFINPIFMNTIHTKIDVSVFLFLFACLYFFKISPGKLILASLTASLIFDFL